MFELSNLSTFVKCGSTLHWWLLKEEGHGLWLWSPLYMACLYMLEKRMKSIEVEHIMFLWSEESSQWARVPQSLTQGK